jgi:hypothetical protein
VFTQPASATAPGTDFSDHVNYWKAGYDAVTITDTAFYRNRSHRTLQDTPDRLEYRRMAMVAEDISAAVLKLAQQ